MSSDGLDINTEATIVIRPGSLSQIILEPQSVSTSPSEQLSFSVLAIDEFGNPLTNIVTTFKADISACQIDAFGRFTASAGAGVYVNAVVVEATDGSILTNAATHVRTDLGRLKQLLLLPETATVQADGEVTFTASALDGWGDAADDAIIGFDRASDAGRIDPKGHFVAAVLAGVFRGAVKVVASSSDASIAAASDVNVTHGAIDHVLIEPSATELRATETISFTARASDAFDNRIESARITWEASGSKGTIGLEGILAAGGRAGFYADAVIVAAELGGISVESSASIRVTPGPLSHATPAPGLIQLTPGSIIQLESPQGFDRHGNPVEGAVVIWSVADKNAGEVSASGLFAAGQSPGDYPNAFEARIFKKGSTRTTSVSVTNLS